MVFDKIKENETVAWATDKFVKAGLIGFIVLGSILILHEVLDLVIDVTVSFGVGGPVL